ncbi:endoglucanase 12-like isoform X2 [Papaver somniferum]|uniref:endoglucanase 12-like isoform X2 n=1 Tax=Papaver somniferum TaxID=3469 RepID=UPI000E700B28|nr:endoglucanase 12-like isoform X2 [Papaver somniferum]
MRVREEDFTRWAVGVASNSSTSPEYCWQIPEDLDHVPVYGAKSVEPDLAGQMAAALGAASILFTNDNAYSAKIVDDAEVLSKFASAPGNHHPYSFVRALLVLIFFRGKSGELWIHGLGIMKEHFKDTE